MLLLRFCSIGSNKSDPNLSAINVKVILAQTLSSWRNGVVISFSMHDPCDVATRDTVLISILFSAFILPGQLPMAPTIISSSQPAESLKLPIIISSPPPPFLQPSLGLNLQKKCLDLTPDFFKEDRFSGCRGHCKQHKVLYYQDRKQHQRKQKQVGRVEHWYP